MQVFFAGKNFQTGLSVTMTAYRLNGTIASQQVAIEVGTTGVYYSDFPSLPGKKVYVIIAEELGGTWKAFKTITL